MAVVMGDTAGMVANMPRSVMPGAGMDTLPFELAVDVAISPEMGEAACAMRGADITRAAAVVGAGIGAVIPDIVWGITAWATAIRTTGMVITVTGPVGTMIRITDIIPTDTIPTDTDIGRL